MNTGEQHKAIFRLLSRGPVRGRKKLQKLIYFLQEGEGEPLGFDYKMHYYGPYSPTLDSRVQALSHAGLVESLASADEVSQFSLGRDAAGSLPEGHEPLDEKVDTVVKRFGNLSPYNIELLGTIHFLARGWHAIGENDINTLESHIRAWKGSKYTRAQIIEGVRRLKGWGYVK
jgi:uncharacterized protein